MSEHLRSWSDIALGSAVFHSDPHERPPVPANANSRENDALLKSLEGKAEAVTTTLLRNANSKRNSFGLLRPVGKGRLTLTIDGTLTDYQDAAADEQKPKKSALDGLVSASGIVTSQPCPIDYPPRDSERRHEIREALLHPSTPGHRSPKD